VAAVVIASVVCVVPTFKPGVWPHKQINLGLDLQGGMHLTLAVEAEKAVKNTMDRTRSELKTLLRENKIRHGEITGSGNNLIAVILFGEDDKVLSNNSKKDKRLINHESIKVPPLYFNKSTDKQLHELSKILSESSYIDVKSRLQKSGLPIGMNILYYGPPGTGKTASALHQAKNSKRKIMMVDISETKSMWFGESEKVIKRIFNDYKSMVEKEKVTPILFFNECDAVFGTRKQIGNSAVDQTENAIQNIILQQLEDMEGIMIATTNLTNNLDPAFERRFLYKILFYLFLDLQGLLHNYH